MSGRDEKRAELLSRRNLLGSLVESYWSARILMNEPMDYEEFCDSCEELIETYSQECKDRLKMLSAGLTKILPEEMKVPIGVTSYLTTLKIVDNIMEEYLKFSKESNSIKDLWEKIYAEYIRAEKELLLYCGK